MALFYSTGVIANGRWQTKLMNELSNITSYQNVTVEQTSRNEAFYLPSAQTASMNFLPSYLALATTTTDVTPG